MPTFFYFIPILKGLDHMPVYYELPYSQTTTTESDGIISSTTINGVNVISGDYDFYPDGEPIQTEKIILNNETSLLVKYEMTFGDLLTSTLLILLLSLQGLKWFHSLIFKKW